MCLSPGPQAMNARVLDRPGTKTAAIMQPYFVPYLGYFQLIRAVDTFVVYDDVQFIKGGWINRNRILIQSAPAYITIPLEKASPNKRIDELSICQALRWRTKMIATLRSAYGRARHFAEVFPLVEEIVSFPESRLAEFLVHSLERLCLALGLTAGFLRSSELKLGVDLAGEARVLEICKSLGARTYVNAIGGTELYSPPAFQNAGIVLKFLKSEPPEYQQGASPHVPSLSIIDVLMFNGLARTRELLECYVLV